MIGDAALPLGESGLSRLLMWSLSLRQQARIKDAARHNEPVRSVRDLPELWQLLQSSTAQVDLVIVSATAADANVLDVIRRIVRERPRAAIVAYCTPGAQQAASLRALAAAGVHQFLLEGSDDSPVALRAVLQDARRQCAADWVLNEMSECFSPAVHPLLETALTAPAEVTSVMDLANALGVHRKTLFNRCRRAGVPVPAELLVWTRLMLVAYFLDATACTVETIANEMGYPSATALRNTLKRYTGRTAQELRRDGAVRAIIQRLRVGAATRAPGDLTLAPDVTVLT